MTKLTDFTIDSFCSLSAQDHAVAIYLYSQRLRQLDRQLERLRQLHGGIEGLSADSNATEQALDMLEESRSCTQMQKIHAVALQELLSLPVSANGATSVALA